MTWGSWGSWGYSSVTIGDSEAVKPRVASPRHDSCVHCGRPHDPRTHHHCDPQPHRGPVNGTDSFDEIATIEHSDYHGQRDRPPQRKKAVHIKALVIVAEECVEKIGTFNIKAPIGVGVTPSGKLTHPIRLEPIGEPVLNPTIIPNKLINEGFVRARLIVDDIDPHPCADARKHVPQLVTVPFQAVHDIPGIEPNDHIQEFAKVETLLVSGTPEVCPPGVSGSVVTLTLKVILRVSIIVARECVLAVPDAKVLRCIPPADD